MAAGRLRMKPPPRLDPGDEPGRGLVIVDVDGTIADVRHRLHHIEGQGRKNWKRFFEAMDDDEPIADIVDMVRALARTNDIVILTGRPDNYEKRTIAWLAKHDVPFSRVLMRRAGDHRQDYVTKEDLLLELPVERVVLALDDRPPVCEMYRRHGIETLEISSDSGNQQVNEFYRRLPD
ncbi:MAG: hypothetical protein ABR587_08170 [Candidatus Binatia bacterium]